VNQGSQWATYQQINELREERLTMNEVRQRKIESYGNAFNVLIEALNEFPREMWRYRATADGWTIHEIVVHIADSEANSYVRCRRFIAEPGQTVTAYDERAWAEVLRYHEQDIDEALELFKWLRLKSYHLIRTLPESTWSNTVYHPENGMMTLDDWLDVYERHVRDHIAQMRAVLQAWQSSQPSP
jgi:hypothetical protein